MGFAARLAREGMSGPFNAFEGIFGVWNQTLSGKKFDINLPDFTSPWDWGIEQTNIKLMPLEIVASFQFYCKIDLGKVKWQKMKSLKIETYKSAWEGAVKDPELGTKTRETADPLYYFQLHVPLLMEKLFLTL